MVQAVLSNLAVILLSHLAITMLLNYRDRMPRGAIRLYSLVIVSLTVIFIFYLPIQIGEYRFDLRLIPLIVLAFYSTLSNTLIVLAVVTVWRFFIGGPDLIPIILWTMVIPTLFTFVYARFVNEKGFLNKIILITLCWLLSDVPLIFVLPNGMGLFKEMFLGRYLSFFTAMLVYFILISHENKRTEMKEQLEFLATHDQLTKLLTKQQCIKLAKRKMDQSKKQHYFAMLDIDHFKRLNDRYGHVVGDRALVHIASLFRSIENDHTLVARYGGEEFMIYMETSSDGEVMKRFLEMQEMIRSTSFEAQGEAISMTVSIGIHQCEEETSIEDTIKEADRKLYEAKRNGRDQIVFAT